MAEIRAFRAYRYDLGRVGNLSEVVAPPYDVIDPALQQALYDRSPYNAIRLELTKDEPGDNEQNNRYTRAARTLKEWIAADVLVQDSARALYVYEQTFEVEGRIYTRRGFFARVRLEPFGSGRIYPHEQTLAGPKADRLALYRATGMNLSSVFGLYPDAANEVFAHFEPVLLKTLPIEATDHLGVTSRLWIITDSALISKVTGLMGPKPIYIADGHHRYETGLKYLAEQIDAGEATHEDAPARFIMMMLVSMSDPGLVILPTHRLVSELPPLSSDQLRAVLQEHFEVELVGTGEAALRETWERIEIDGTQAILGFGTAVDGVWLTAKLRDSSIMERLVPEHSAAWRELAVSVLHVLVLDHLLAPRFGVQPRCKYVHLLQEVADAIHARQVPLSVLVPPATMTHVELIAGNLEKMPPKSTYFYPKLLTGMVFNSLRSH